MGANDRITGKNLAIFYVTSAGTVELSGSQRSLEIEEEQEFVDATAGADDYRVNAPTVKMISAEVEILVETLAAGSAVLDAVQPGTAIGTLFWGREGTAAGKPKDGFEASVSAAPLSLPYDDVVTISVSFVNRGSSLVFDSRNGGDTF